MILIDNLGPQPTVKTMRSTIIIILLFACIPVFAQNSKEDKKEARYQAVLELIETEKFEFIAKRANPPKVRSIDLTTNPNFLRINKGSAHADIPYFGRAFSGGYSSSDGGIKFDGPFETYDVQKNENKKRVIIKFKVKGADDTYSCTLTLNSIENVSLNVISNKRQSINYTGYIKELTEE